MEIPDWNRYLLLGSLLIVVAGMALASGRLVRDRVLAVGMLVQGIAVTFVAGGAFFPRAELEVAALAILPLFAVWALWVLQEDLPERVIRTGPESAVDASTPILTPLVTAPLPESASDLKPDATASMDGESKDAE